MPRVLNGRFEVGRFLAAGGMSVVHEGRDRALECAVVIKFLLPVLHDDDEAVARFRREPRVLAALGGVSDGFVRPLDAGAHQGLRYIVTERLDGETLFATLARRSLALDEAVLAVNDVARSLGAAHRLGVIHRDIKPENMFRVRRDGVQRYKVLDLGIAKQIDPREPLVKTASLGTPFYMAPESLASGPIDHRVDGWALAAVAYHALTGRPPFFADTLMNLIRMVCWSDELPPPVSSLVPDLPASLDAWFTSALSRDPEKRFSSMAELAGTFEAAAAG